MSEMTDLLNLSKTPAFRIMIAGKDATQTLDKRLLSMTLTDNRGFEADQLDLELDDADVLVIMPRRGAVISMALGWKGEPLFSKGNFTVDEIEHSGSPDRLTIRARSADFRETLNVRREKSWHQTTVGEVVKEIATRHSLKAAIGKDVAAQVLDHLDQTNESDAGHHYYPPGRWQSSLQPGGQGSVHRGNCSLAAYARTGEKRNHQSEAPPEDDKTKRARSKAGRLSDRDG